VSGERGSIMGGARGLCVWAAAVAAEGLSPVCTPTCHPCKHQIVPSFVFGFVLHSVKVTVRPTGSQSVSMSWCRAQSGTFDQRFFFFPKLRSCLCGAPSLTRGQICHLSIHINTVYSSQTTQCQGHGKRLRT
jgi:hypothetical protein